MLTRLFTGVIELLRNSKDKRARKLAKKRVRVEPFYLCLA